MTHLPHRIQIVGIGADGASGLSSRARAVIDAAATLYGGTRHLEMFPDHPARRVDLSGECNAIEELISGDCGAHAVVLASGDPMLFGIGATLARRLGPEAASCLEVIAHPSSVQLAFAALSEPLSEVAVLSAHGRPIAPVLSAAMPEARFAVLLSPEHPAEVVARALLDAGMEDASAAVCAYLGSKDEQVTRGTLSSVARGTFPALAVLVVLRAPHEIAYYRRSAIPVAAFAHRDGMITKPEVRALAIAALHLAPDHTLWDIGAGSGSVAVEAALSLPHGRVFAVDRDPEQVAQIEENKRRLRTPQVTAVHGDAPAALAALPDPDAIFIGGGGAELAPIVAAARARLKPGRHLALTLVTLEHLSSVLTLFPSSWNPAVSQLSIAHGIPLAGGTRLEPANPVFLLTAQAPVERASRA